MTTDILRSRVLRDTYRDSIDLMRIAADLEGLAGVRRAAVVMATPANCQLLARGGLSADAAAAARPSDLVVAVAAADEPAAEAALARAVALLSAPPTVPAGATEATPPRTIAAAVAHLPGANLALISTPGAYATAEALKALKRGMHVFLFSDNVPVEDEIELKRLAVRKGLLVMGPDCGTALVDGIPLGFANAVRRGRVGLVGASGTGLQQVACLVDRFGAGISQAIGVGGRDLDERVGGLMMLAGIERLLADPDTAVLVLVSKPPAEAVARRVLDHATGGSLAEPPKPLVACFLGGDPTVARARGVIPAATLEEAAMLAVELAAGKRPVERGRGDGDRGLRRTAAALASRLAPGQRAICGLYSGGTLCREAALVVAEVLGPAPGGDGHTLVDLGDDEFTVGRLHPMIDFRLRNERLLAAAADPTTAVLLLDVVLGYGSHPDPAGALEPALAQARAHARAAGRTLVVVGSVCGTPADPQGIGQQEARLAAAGVRLLPSNAQAARLAALIGLEVRATRPARRRARKPGRG